MWGDLLFAWLACCLLLYVPGYAAMRGLGLSRVLALCCAPLFSVCWYAALPVAYYQLGIACSPASILVPTMLLGLLLLGIGHVSGFSKRHHLAPPAMDDIRIMGRELSYDVVVPVVFVAVATLICVIVFLFALPSADAINQRQDNQTHLNLLRSFAESGKWSSLHTSTFLASPISARSFASDGSFYPSAWCCVVVLTHLVSGANLMACANAVVAVAASVVFPLGMYVFLRVLLRDKRRAIALGAIAATAFSIWPWLYVYSGPLYPNQLGISLQFGVLALVMAYVRSCSLRQMVAPLLVIGALSFLALALTHPTTVFGTYVFLVFYFAHHICKTLEGRRRWVVLVSFLLGVTLFWVWCHQLSPLQSVIGYYEAGTHDLGAALLDILLVRNEFVPAQVSLAIVCAVGCACVATSRDLRWTLLPVAFYALAFVATRMDWWAVKHWLSSLWYSDWRRMLANMTLCMMPAAALGLDALLPSRESSRTRQGYARVAITVLLVCGAYVPSFEIPIAHAQVDTAFGVAQRTIRERHSEQVYSPEEVQFVREALEVIPPNSLVVNAPGDGSLWAYGANGLNTLYRSIEPKGTTPDATIIREHLCEYATSQAVRDAVAKTGAKYVLLLDKGVSHEDGHWIWQFDKDHMDAWRGVNAIDDNTPGFTDVLSKGDEMRLYRIGDV